MVKKTEGANGSKSNTSSKTTKSGSGGKKSPKKSNSIAKLSDTETLVERQESDDMPSPSSFFEINSSVAPSDLFSPSSIVFF